MTGQISLSHRGPLYERVAAVGTLTDAWEKVQANQGCAGGDGVTVSRFSAVATAQIEQLSRQLGAGHYRPGPARRVHVPKKGGGLRPLDIPCISDRVVQAAATLVLTPLLEPHMEDSSFAYRKGRSVAQAVARVARLRRQGFDHVVDGDIQTYFEAIPHERLISKLESLVDDTALIDLIWLWLEHYSLTGRGIPQGAPISPLLANLYLDSVDEAIEARGARLVRFADDWLVLCRSRDYAEGALERMRVLLAEEGLDLNPDKTRITSFQEGFRFLGHIFVRSLVAQEVRVDDTPSGDAVDAAERAALRAIDAEKEPEPPETGDDRRRSDPVFPVYVVEPGRKLETLGGRLRLVDDIGRIVDLPPGRIDRIELGGEAEATLEALDFAAANGVEVVRINGHGQTVGRWEVPAPERAARHLAQAGVILDTDKRDDLARRLVEGRVRNQRALLRRLNRERDDPEIAAAATSLNRIIRKLRSAGGLDRLRGIEGEAAALYWPALGRALPGEFQFVHRRRKPVQDPANAALNVLSGLLTRDIRTVADRAGLHHGFGTLHVSHDGTEALVYDLVEEFRAPVAEACCVALFNRKALRSDLFAFDRTGLRMDREAYGILVRGYERWLGRPIKSPRSGNKVLWRALMLEQARAYADHCEGGEAYVSYRMDY